MKVYTIYCVNIKKEKKTSIHTKEVNHVHCAIMKHQEREKEKEREHNQQQGWTESSKRKQ